MLTTNERLGMIEQMSDLSKDATGSRVRLDWASMTDKELSSWTDYFCSELDKQENDAIKTMREWEANIERLVALGAGDRKTAIRWDMEAYSIMTPKPDHDRISDYCFMSNIPFRMIPIIQEQLAA